MFFKNIKCVPDFSTFLKKKNEVRSGVPAFRRSGIPTFRRPGVPGFTNSPGERSIVWRFLQFGIKQSTENFFSLV